VDEHNWNAQVDRLEQEGRGLLEVIVTAATWASELSGPAGRIIDVGSGPGVGTCELALRFPHSHVVAVDASEAMLSRVSQRARELDLTDRVSTHLAELPGGLPQLPPADIVFASMFLHHTADTDKALRELRKVLAPDGLLVVIEHGPGPTPDHVPRIDTVAALGANNYDVIGERVSAGRSLIVARAASTQDLV
jgi:ubiquinone/menaquinone biosynthesis C-methylase UbiE